jgi:threonylcarbamoyladenosine tRNA methylthiotransferase MtaB
MTTVAFATLGCKVNQFESEALMGSLAERGYDLVPFGEKADITIINTCTVTHRADFQSRQMVRRALRSNPESLLVVTGCYVQVDAEEFKEMERVRVLLGNEEKMRLPDLLPLIERGELPRVQVSDIRKAASFSEVSLYSFHHHTRAFLKVQDGCNGHCSYCIVPFARGKSRSLPLEKVFGHLRRLKEKGFKEVVLTGIHLGAYGLDLLPSSSLEKLLERLEVEETPGRVRLSSIEPLDFSPEIISLLSRSSKVCPHLHIPIQSGEDEILKRMERNYDPAFLSDLVWELYGRIPDLSIGADVIVGFPGETEEKFERTYRWVESHPLSYLHVFPFSKRKGTAASGFSQEVNREIVKGRAERMRALGKQKRDSFYRRFLQRELAVLVEDRREKVSGRWKGFSRNYIPVLLSHKGAAQEDPDWVNQEWRVRANALTEKGLVGEVVGRQM